MIKKQRYKKLNLLIEKNFCHLSAFDLDLLAAEYEYSTTRIIQLTRIYSTYATAILYQDPQDIFDPIL